MSKVTPALNAQAHVNEYFQTHAAHWNDIYGTYGDGDVWSHVHRDRHQMALGWVESLALAPGAHVLEVGCGAGLFAVDLALRGLHVVAIDPVEAMVAQARQHAAQAGVDDALSVAMGDATALTFPDGSFDLVVALGVLPWLEDPQSALIEMARVTCPGGYVLVTDDNRARLHSFFDPWLNPGTAWLKRLVKSALVRAGVYHPSGRSLGARLRSARFTDLALDGVGLSKMRGATVGFGPFTLFRRSVLPPTSAVALHHRLQELANRGVPVLRATGSQYMALACKR